MNINELRELKYELGKQISETEKQINNYYNQIKREEASLVNLNYELKSIEKKIKYLEEESI